MNQFIGYPKCSTCQKAKQWLEQHQIDYEFRNIKEEKLNEAELSEIIERSQGEIKKFFNTSGLLYKELNLKDRLPLMSKEEQISLLASNGMLVKRPLLINDDFILIGFKEDTYKILL